MEQWEYRIFVSVADGGSAVGFTYKWAHDRKDSRSIEQLLNDQGRENWELVNVTVVPFGTVAGGHLHYVFKKPKA